MDILTTWILWAIIETAKPNVNGFALLDEFSERKDCVEASKRVVAKGIPIPPKSTITAVTMACIPVATRISKNAN